MIAALYQLFTGRDWRWLKVRADHLVKQPICAACGSHDDLEVHHKVPVHVDGRLELDPRNLVTLCRVHHFWLGHLGDWQSWNPEIVEDCLVMLRKVVNRPYKRTA